MIYSRDIPLTAPTDDLRVTKDHIRAHLSACCTPDDNPYTLATHVVITASEANGMLRLTGELDAEPVAPYLRDDWTPEHDIVMNPLSVPSINDETPQ